MKTGMAQVAKAIIAAVTTLSGTVVTAAIDQTITPVEYVLIATATVAAYFGVWATTNKPAE